MGKMTFSRSVFLVAGIYGILVVGPMYFTETQVNQQFPPAISHAEYCYGFVGVTLAWQFAFLLIGMNPRHYRMLMIPSVFEKWPYVVALALFYFQNRVAAFVATLASLILSSGLSF